MDIKEWNSIGLYSKLCPRHLTTAWVWAEDVLGAFVTFLVSLLVIFATIMIGADTSTHPWFAGYIRIGFVALVCTLESMFLISIIGCLRFRLRPYALSVPHVMARLPYPLRPVASLFWLLHLIGAMAFVWLAQSVSESSPVLAQVGANLLGCLCSYWAFGYLLLAIACLKRDSRWVRFAWRYRACYLAGIGAFAFLLPYTGLVSSHKNHVEIVGPGKSTFKLGDQTATIKLEIRNGEAETIRVLRDIDWDDFHISVTSPDGIVYTRWKNPVRRAWGHNEEDYKEVSPGSTVEFCSLHLVPGVLLGGTTEWRPLLADDSARGPFAKVGRYRIEFNYLDFAAVSHGGLTGVSPHTLLVVIE